MDPYAPIQGISLERYAELGAELDGIDEPGEQRKKVQELGVDPDAFEAAKEGWTARMQDMSNMGQIATRYMQLYNAALANKKGTASLSFEEWCYVSATIQVFGPEAALNHHDLSQGDWTTISAEWTTKMSQDPSLAQQRNALQQQEAQRLQSGGQPRAVHVQRTAGGGQGATPAGGAQAFDPQAQMQAQMQAAGAHPAAMAQAQAAMAQMGMGGMGAMGGMGGAPGQSGMAPGSQVKVQWSDGNQYQATVTQSSGGQIQIQFPNGHSLWVDPQHLSPA